MYYIYLIQQDIEWLILEKYIFELIPDITLLPDFPENINDNTIAIVF